MLSYYVSLRSVFRVVMSVTIFALKRCLVRLYLQLFVGGFMSYLRVFDYLRIVVSKAYCVVVFFGFLFSSCVPYVASYSRLSIFD